MEISYRERAKIWLAIENNRTSSINNMLHPMLMLLVARNLELRLSLVNEFHFDSALKFNSY